MRTLICLDGSPMAMQAAQLAAPILALPGMRVTVFGVIERQRQAAAIQRSVADAQAWMAEAGIDAMVKVVHHRAVDAILVEAEGGHYDLVVLGDPGRRGLARFIGTSVVSRVVRDAPCAVLVGRAASQRLRRVLVCTAGGAPGLHDVAFTAPLAAAAGPAVTVLHVLSQVVLRGDADASWLDATAEELVARDTPEGRHLAEARRILSEAGVAATLKVRRGLVLDEIDAEVRAGGYDLVVVGATLARGFGRLLLDDVTSGVMNALDIAILVVPSPAAKG